ncbi:Mucin-2 [Xylographa trunciseda]|nr:Mucin-2 [Xylographa trunciseda]
MASRISFACSCHAATASPPLTTTSFTCAISTIIATFTAVQTQAASTLTLPPDTVALTLPPNTVTLPPDTVTLTLAPVTTTVTAPGTAVTAPPGYSLGFGFNPLIDFVSDDVVRFAAFQDPANAYAGQSYLSASFEPSIDSGDVTPQITVNVQPNTQYVADGYIKKGLAAGTCTIAIAVLNGAGTAYLNADNGGIITSVLSRRRIATIAPLSIPAPIRRCRSAIYQAAVMRMAPRSITIT